MKRSTMLRRAHDEMFRLLGPQGWWPAETRFEMLVGAILVQRTRWENAAMSMARLAEAGMLDPTTLAACEEDRLIEMLRPSGFMAAKSRACRAMAAWVASSGAERSTLPDLEDGELRARLLALPGVGPETADAMLLYAFDRRVFIADAYARRLFEALGDRPPAGYEPFRRHVEQAVRDAGFDLQELRELHALIDEFGKLVARGERSYALLVPGARSGDSLR